MELHGGNGADTLVGGNGDDVLYGFGGNDTMYGGKGNDVLAGGAGNDKLYGGDGDDYLLGGPGNDLIDGGAGNNWASYEDATASVKVDLTKTGAQDTGGGGVDTLVNIQNLHGSDHGDILTGDAHDNYIYGGAGDDRIYGGAGDDHLSGGGGNNYLDGGDGFDTVDYGQSATGVTVHLDMGLPPMGGSGWTGDFLVSIEAVMGSTHDDDITGGQAENYLFGDKGNDVIHGVNGNDTLDGGEGNDTLYASSSADGHGDLLIGGQGADTSHGGPGVDTFLFNSGDSDWTPTGDQMDTVIGFEKQDKLSFAGVNATGIATTTLDSFDKVYAAATYVLGHAGVVDGHPVTIYAAFQVGADTYVVANDPGSADHGLFTVKLAGFTATDLSMANFV